MTAIPESEQASAMVFNVCPACGAWGNDKRVEAAGGTDAVAVCAGCGERIPFRRLPLFAVTGASGAGKTALALALPRLLPECVVLETDILWGALPATADDNFRSYHEHWLRLAKNIHQAGRPVVLCGTILPEQLEESVERRYLGPIHYLALVCDDTTLANRLWARPSWRNAGDQAFLDRMLAFNGWLRTQAAETTPPLTLLDTSAAPLAQTAHQVAAWVRQRLPVPASPD